LRKGYRVFALALVFLGVLLIGVVALFHSLKSAGHLPGN